MSRGHGRNSCSFAPLSHLWERGGGEGRRLNEVTRHHAWQTPASPPTPLPQAGERRQPAHLRRTTQRKRAAVAAR
ncbi:hypothetical protein CBM2585_A150005 [Cupriavidus taiwanensis]|nr:hypothetical protein CBM2585_A150005 [Cupriavidus taiwanensis]